MYKGQHVPTGNVVALKRVWCDTSDLESVKMMATEIVVLRHLDHPSVIKLDGIIASTTSKSLYLVFEYMEHDLANPHMRFTEPKLNFDHNIYTNPFFVKLIWTLYVFEYRRSSIICISLSLLSSIVASSAAS